MGYFNEVNAIIHGFSGSTKEIIYLKNYLNHQGLNAHTITLAGHGGTRKDLYRTSHIDWLNSAEIEIARLRKQYRRINLVGFSMGGLISANLSTIYDVDKLVLVNTPVYVWNMRVIFKQILNDLRNGERENIEYFKKGMSIVSPKSSIEFFKILNKSKKIFNQVPSQSFIMQCLEDETVHYRSAEYIKNELGERAQVRYYNGGCHQVFLRNTSIRDAFCHEIYNFLK